MKDIAIIGFSGVFPDAASVNEFAENLLAGKCSINDISDKRLFDTSISKEISCYKAGYLEEITSFDYSFFNISLGEAEEMAPHQRLVLQEAYKTFESAGYRLKDLKESNTAVYVADSDSDYYLLATESTPTLIAGNTSAMLGSRISRFFDLRGLSLNVDTTCSSSLTAVTLACKDILLGETNLALVCGVNINVVPPQKESGIVLGVEAENGSCTPFSDNAQGTLPGEAVTCILLKSLAQAEIDGDIIYGVIKGFALNQDGGQSASIMAPSEDAQAAVIQKALDKSSLTPNDVTFIEAHGTGTKLGDPIEIEGIAKVFKDALENDEKIYLSAVKSNIGHADSAAGLAGLIKILLSFKNNIIYPSVNALPLNSYIDFEKSKVAVVTEPISWDDVKKKDRKIAGISSFGLIGTNVHLVLEAPEKQNVSSAENSTQEYVFCFSAKSETSLIKYLQSFQSYLKETTAAVKDISNTLNNCREIYQYRYVTTADSIQGLLNILETVTTEMLTDSNTVHYKNSLLLFEDAVAIEQKELEAITEYKNYSSQLLNKEQKSLFVQYESYKALLKSGVAIKEMIGIGIGKIVLKVLKKELSFEEALNLAGEDSKELESGIEELKERAKKLIDKYPDGLQLISIGYQGKLGQIFSQFASEHFCYTAIGYAVSGKENVKALLGLGYDIDLKAWHIDSRFSKVELPSYVFDTKRCWLRTTDNPYNPNVLTTQKEKVAANNNHLPVVEQLRIMWSEVLKTDMKNEDDFFDLGGHSLNGMQLINKINESFNLNLNIDDLFERGTPQDMSELIISIDDKAVRGKNEIEVVEKQELYEVSFAQKRLWLLAKMSNNTSSLNVPLSIVIDGVLDFVNLVKAYNTIIERHESLRTTFVFSEGKLKQKIHAIEELENSIKFEIKENLSKEALNSYVLKLEEASFDLNNNSLIRANLIKIQDNKHVLSITLHHLICDGWSIEIFQKELFYAYNSFCSNEKPQLESLKIQYKDYTYWQQKNFDEASFKESEAFWISQFNDAPKPLNLQLQKNRPDVKTYKGSIDTFTIPQELNVKIKELLKAEEITLTMFLGTVLNVLLSKLSGASDITIGLPIANRNHKDLENQIGIYLNTIAVRSKFSSDISFKSLIKEVSNNLKAAYKNQVYPFELLIEKLNLPKDYSRTPLFDTVLTVQNYLNINILNELQSPGENALKLDYLTIDNYSSAQFDLVFRFVDLEDKLFYELEYNTDLYSKETIALYHSFLITLLDDCLNQNEVTIDALSLISQNDITKQLNQLAGTDKKVEVKENIVEYLSSIFTSCSQNTAIAFEEEYYSYEQLDIFSNKLAHYLLSNNELKSEDKVIVSCEISPLLIVALLGVMKAGLVYVPLDKNMPAERQSYIFDDVQAKLMINDEWLSNFVSDSIGLPVSKLDITISKEQLAYIIYTSGSTGKPKGVMITHGSLMELMLNCKEAHFEFSDKDVWTLYHNYSFDFSIWEIFGPLFFGAQLILIDRSKIIDFTAYFEVIKKHKVTVLNFTPKVFAEFDNLRVKKNEYFDSLRYLIFGGDTLYPAIFKNWYNLHKSCKIINMYGITEITVHGTFKELTTEDIFEKGTISNIGKPLQGMKFYILDENGKLLPEGIIGEIFIAGNQLSKGYYNKEELTQERFLANNHYQLGTLYKSGDLARWLPNGDLEYIGRIDNQIQLNGFRIELNEIENVLIEHPAVEKAYVTSINEENKTSLLAYFTAKEPLKAEDLKLHLKKYLPHYMIPAFIVQVDEFEVNSNGKIDKSKLPDLNKIKNTKETEQVFEGNVKQKIHALFCRILNYQEVSAAENFFDLGGSSLQLIQFHSEIEELWPNKMQISDLFEFNTIEKIASFIEGNLENIATSELSSSENIEFFEI